MHLPLKVAMHAVNPVQRLRVLRARMERQTADTMEPEWIFHRAMSSIFHSVRDLHTNYLLPAPFAGKIAFLPFMIEKCYDPDGAEHYLITQTVAGYRRRSSARASRSRTGTVRRSPAPSRSTAPCSPAATRRPTSPAAWSRSPCDRWSSSYRRTRTG